MEGILKFRKEPTKKKKCLKINFINLVPQLISNNENNELKNSLTLFHKFSFQNGIANDNSMKKIFRGEQDEFEEIVVETKNEISKENLNKKLNKNELYHQVSKHEEIINDRNSNKIENQFNKLNTQLFFEEKNQNLIGNENNNLLQISDEKSANMNDLKKNELYNIEKNEDIIMMKSEIINKDKDLEKLKKSNIVLQNFGSSQPNINNSLENMILEAQKRRKN